MLRPEAEATPTVAASRGLRRVLIVSALVFSWAGVGGLNISARAGDPADASAGSHKWAVLIGIEHYQRANPLRFTLNDVKRLSETLTLRGDFDRVVKFVDNSDQERFRPSRANLMRELPEFLGKPGADDLVLVYFSGHGFKDKAGNLYLAPIDCDPANPPPTGIALEWLREKLAACKAKLKVLVLDACHAGTEKGSGAADSVAADELGAPFGELDGVVTLASSSTNEQSQIWELKRQSLFSYWLDQGLRGHADLDLDGEITLDELYNYVYRHVTRSAKVEFSLTQTPVRIVRSDVPGVPVLVRLKPQRLKAMLAEMAEQLSWNLGENHLKKVGVLEFTNDTKVGELLGGDFGLLGKYCAEELERRLAALGSEEHTFSVVDRRRLTTALEEQHFGLKDLGSSGALAGLSRASGGLPALAVGTLRNRVGRLVNLQCKLVRTDEDELAGSVGGVAALDESEWAMVGRSVAVKAADRQPVVARRA